MWKKIKDKLKKYENGLSFSYNTAFGIQTVSDNPFE